MFELKNNKTIFFIALSLIVLHVFALYYYELPLLYTFPFLLGGITLAFVRFDYLFFLVVFLVPLSIPMREASPDISFDLSIPAEPLIFALMALFFAKYLLGDIRNKKIFNHPVSIAIYCYLGWMFVTTLTSSSLLVSFKFLLARVWFVTAFYFLPLFLFNNLNNISKYIWAYLLSFIITIFYTLKNQIASGLNNQQAANYACNPYFSDHTSYGAALALFLPLLIGYLFAIRKNKNLILKSIVVSAIVLLAFALIYSYTRAAWLGVIVSVGFLIVVLLRIKLIYLLTVSAFLISFFFSFQTEIMNMIQKNNNVSDKSFAKHISSMSNVTTDVSNLERINRWKCAILMWQERPILGWGPGTYQFEYGAMQAANDFTEISTFAGDRGTAHSEFLLPLSEQGVPGPIFYIIIIIVTLYTGISTFYRAKNRKIRILVLAALAGLVTYYVHSVLNNFLDTDKLSVLFWGFTAIVVSGNIYYSKK